MVFKLAAVVLGQLTFEVIGHQFHQFFTIHRVNYLSKAILRFKVLFKRAPDLGAGPVKEDPLVYFGNA
jgi:hypothetical protein